MKGKVLIVKHIPNEGPGLIGPFFEKQDWPIEIVDLSQGDRLPHTLDDLAAVVALGGPMNVYEEDKYPFLKKEDDFISRLIVEEIPFLGICLGAQLLAKACQGRVFRADAGELGWYNVSLTGEGARDTLFLGLTSRLTVFQWHDDTFEIPDGGKLLVQGKPCRNQGFKMGEFAYGLQFHMEVTPDMVEAWMEDLDDAVDVKKIIEGSMQKRETMERQATTILSNFQRIIESSLRFRRILKQYLDERSWLEKREICWWELS